MNQPINIVLEFTLKPMGLRREQREKMKKFAFMGIVLFIGLVVCSVYSFAESFDGFRGLKWGSAPAKGMKEGLGSGVYRTYKRPSDALRITGGRFNLSVDLNAI